MALFRWSSIYVVHLADVDAEHQRIFRLGADFHEALVNGAAPSIWLPILKELTDETVSHFQHEEEMMAATKCPSLDWHRSQHQALLKKFAALEAELQSGDREVALELLHFLAGWLKEHTRLPDRIMGAHLRNFQRANAVRPTA
jgi:hemerythrin